MKTVYKVIISFCVGIALIAIGVSMGGLSQMRFTNILGHFDWRWNAQEINDIDYQSDSLINEFDINIHNGTIQFIESDTDKVVVKANHVYDGFEVYQTGNTVVIEQDHYWNWFKSYESSEIEVYVPRGQIIQKTKINVNAGQLKLYDLKTNKAEFNVGAGNLKMDNVICQEMKLDVGMGNANGDHILIQDTVNVNVGMGNADIDLVGNEEEYNYKMKIGLGSVKIGNEKSFGLGNEKSYRGSTDKMIDVNCGMGAVKIDMEG